MSLIIMLAVTGIISALLGALYYKFTLRNYIIIHKKSALPKNIKSSPYTIKISRNSVGNKIYNIFENGYYRLTKYSLDDAIKDVNEMEMLGGYTLTTYDKEK